MALYAIGDFHLSFQTDKAMDRFGTVWRKHEEKIQKNCNQLLRAEDTLVITGDHSWGRKLKECREDLAFIEALPGRKILLRGNHDMFWDAKKTESLNREYQGRLAFLHNYYYGYEDYALVGTMGFSFEGPFYLDRRGRIVGWDEEKEAHANRLVEREIARLQQSFDAALADGYQKFLMFLHYPPTSVIERESPFTRMAEQYQVEHVVYSHCHGESRFHDSIRGDYHGISYHLVSGDFLKFRPQRIV
ncbi:MAG: metallophosphoesterase [Clostridiales bacterium]|nr:metallophosphoesterase [Clostridiales bacterium]